jgi:hypothetical protein
MNGGFGAKLIQHIQTSNRYCNSNEMTKIMTRQIKTCDMHEIGHFASCNRK